MLSYLNNPFATIEENTLVPPTDATFYDNYFNPLPNDFFNNPITRVSSDTPLVDTCDNYNELFNTISLEIFNTKPTILQQQEPNPFETSFGNFVSSPQSISSPISLHMPTNIKKTKAKNTASKEAKKSRRNKATRDETLLRNREAAARSRQKKKEWLRQKELETEALNQQNDRLADQIDELKNEILNIKMVLATHEDCNL